MKESINFDRAAAIYDATRKLPDDAAEAITQALLREIHATGADRVLEVGIGTGRIARPLMREGVRMVGVDISRQMMTRLKEQLTPDQTQPDLVLGDGTCLPITDDSFRAALVVHVFHLVQSIEKTISEVRRVLAAEGALLHQSRRAAEATERMWDDSMAEWRRVLAVRGYVGKSRREMSEIRAALVASGGKMQEMDVIASPEVWTADQEMERLRNRQSAWTWAVPSDIFDDALPEYEAWLRRALPEGTFRDDVTLTIERWSWD